MHRSNPLRFGTLAAIILAAALARLAVPGLLGPSANFSPIGAIALFGGAYFGRSWAAFAIPIAALWISDWAVNLLHSGTFNPFYEGFYWQYLAFALVVLLGSVTLKKVGPVRLAGASILASLTFFAVSNLGVWASGTMYPLTPTGLSACFLAALPFFQNTLLGDLFFSAFTFGAFALAKSYFPALSTNSPGQHAPAV